jgi:hypothetical protein
MSEKTMQITEQDYQLLSRYVDRELSLPASRQLEQRLAAEPTLKAALASLQSLQGRLQSAYSELAREPVPAHIVALLEPQQARIVPLPHKRARGLGFALAASLVVAASATLVTQWGQNAGQSGSHPDALLAATLEQTPSMATGWETLADGRQIRPVLSFHSRAGDWCREYLLNDDGDNWHAVACRRNEGWANTVINRTDPAQPGDEYRPAGAADTALVADYIDRNATDIPLDAAQEAAIIARNWH